MATSRQLRDEAIRLGIDPDILEKVADDATNDAQGAAVRIFLPVIVNVYNREHTATKLELVYENDVIIGVKGVSG